MHVLNGRLWFDLWKFKNIIKFLDNITTYLFHKHKSPCIILWGECGILFIHRYFCDVKIQWLSSWKVNKSLLCTNLIYNFSKVFQTLRQTQYLKHFLTISIPFMVVWIVCQEIVHFRFFLDLKWYEMGNGRLQGHNPVQQTEKSLCSIWIP